MLTRFKRRGSRILGYVQIYLSALIRTVLKRQIQAVTALTLKRILGNHSLMSGRRCRPVYMYALLLD